MATLIILIFFAAAIGALSVVISNLSDLQAAKLDTAGLRQEIGAAIQNADPSQMTALCAAHPESALSRVLRDLFAKSDQLPADDAIRSELFRMRLGQALARETERASRGPNLLRTIGFTCIPLGMMATGWDMANAIASPGWRDSNHLVLPYAAMASAVPYMIAGLLLSLTVLALYKYLKSRLGTALSELDDSCSDILCAFLSRPTGKRPQRTAGLIYGRVPETGQDSPIPSQEGS